MCRPVGGLPASGPAGVWSPLATGPARLGRMLPAGLGVMDRARPAFLVSRLCGTRRGRAGDSPRQETRRGTQGDSPRDSGRLAAAGVSAGRSFGRQRGHRSTASRADQPESRRSVSQPPSTTRRSPRSAGAPPALSALSPLCRRSLTLPALPRSAGAPPALPALSPLCRRSPCSASDVSWPLADDVLLLLGG